MSAVGRDLLGEELLRRLRHWDLPAELVTRHSGLPTGYGRASLGAQGDATYDITASVAWDQIVVDEDITQAALGARAHVFGSLAQRSAFNRTALDHILAVLPADAWRVFDVNLRPPHDDLNLVRTLAPRATLLKLNAAEAARLTDAGKEQPGREERDARELHSRHGCPYICVTAGSRGAGLLHKDAWHWEPARPVRVTEKESLARACRLGEWVASQSGAPPAYASPTPV